MGIMDVFRNAVQSAAPTGPGTQGNPPTPGNIPTTTPTTGVTTPGAAPNGTNPGTGTVSDPNAAPTPFADFADLWKDAPIDPNAPPKDSSMFGNIDPAKLLEAAKKINFAEAATADQQTAIMAGGEGAVKAMMEVMNSVAQRSYAQSAYASTRMVETAMAKAREQFTAELPQLIKKTNVSNSLREENPIFSNPAVAPIMDALESRLTIKYPTASASEITGMAKAYVEQMGTSFAPKAPEPKLSKGARADEDWGKFLE